MRSIANESEHSETITRMGFSKICESSAQRLGQQITIEYAYGFLSK